MRYGAKENCGLLSFSSDQNGDLRVKGDFHFPADWADKFEICVTGVGN